MCQTGGPRCANHTNKDRQKLGAIQDRTPEQEAELKKANLQYFGTPTGQKELTAKLESMKPDTKEAVTLESYKEKASENYRKDKIVGKVARSENLSDFSEEDRETAIMQTDNKKLVNRMALEDPDTHLRSLALRRKTLINPETYNQSADSKDLETRYIVARHVTDDKAQRNLSVDKSHDVRRRLAENENLHKDVVYSLAVDKSDAVRQKLAKSQSDPYALDYMKRDTNPYIREEVARNQNTSSHTLQDLSQDESVRVCEGFCLNS